MPCMENSGHCRHFDSCPPDQVYGWCAENCRLPKSLWRTDSPTQVATRVSHFFGRDRGLNHPEMCFAFRHLPPDAPFSTVLEELRTPGGFEYLGFLPKWNRDGTAAKNHNADDVLKQVLFLHYLLHSIGSTRQPWLMDIVLQSQVLYRSYTIHIHTSHCNSADSKTYI